MSKHNFTDNQKNIVKELLSKNANELKIHISRGNTKLHFFNFGLPAVFTCGDACKHNAACTNFCYALNAENRYINVFRANYENLILFNKDPERFKELLVRAIELYVRYCEKNNINLVIRLNESGDFVNNNYAKMIFDVVTMFPAVSFYGYTKNYFSIDFVNDIPFHKLANCNLLLSKIENVDIPKKYAGLYNIAYTSKLNNGLLNLLNIGVKHCTGNCNACRACLNRGNDVVFVIHGSGNYDYIPEKENNSVLEKFNAENMPGYTFFKTTGKTFQNIRNIYCKKIINNNTYEARTVNLLTVYKLYKSGKIKIFKNGIAIKNI